MRFRILEGKGLSSVTSKMQAHTYGEGGVEFVGNTTIGEGRANKMAEIN